MKPRPVDAQRREDDRMVAFADTLLAVLDIPEVAAVIARAVEPHLHARQARATVTTPQTATARGKGSTRRG